MGITVRAELQYGYNLGDEENGWAFAEVDDDNEPTMPWWDENGDSLTEQAKEQLLHAVGFTETDYHANGYFDRRRDAEARTGVEFEITGYEACRTILAAAGTEHQAYSSEVIELDPDILKATATDAMDQALAAALKTLGITPTQPKPAWLLTCYYG